LYALADLERLRVLKQARAGHGAVAAGALRWGEPVLDSAITAITPQGPAYRGRLATELAQGGVKLENVAELLWSGYLPPQPITWPSTAIPIAQLARLIPYDTRPLDAMPLVVHAAALADPQRGDRRPDAIVARARRLLPMLAAALAPELNPAAVTRALGAGRVGAIATRALGLDESATPGIDLCLVLLADHELNASSFAARIAASTDADPYACVAAALAALSGPRHGTAVEAVARLVEEVGTPEHARPHMRALRRTGELPPGFGHPLYPEGDPRALPLLAWARRSSDRRVRTLLAIVEAVADAAPNVDAGLAALAFAIGIRPTAASGLFAVARSAGWIAHALEQRAAGFLLRPRARYTGVPVTP
jgi:citrate synthase